MSYQKYQKMVESRILEEKGEPNEKKGKHVAILIQNGKIVSTGYSNNNRTYFSGLKTSSMHSEMHCVNQLLLPTERNLLKRTCNMEYVDRSHCKLSRFKS